MTPRDPWLELTRAANAMASRRGDLARTAAREDATAPEMAEASRRATEAAARFGQLVAELDICYQGVRVAHCSSCDRLRRMSAPREWDTDLGIGTTAECLFCGSTVQVDEKRPGEEPPHRTAGDDAAEAGRRGPKDNTRRAS